MGNRRSRRPRREPSQGNPSPANAPRAKRIDALLEPVQKIDPTAIADEQARAMVGWLLNVVEDLRGELRKAHQEIAYLREQLRLGQGGEGRSGDRPGSSPSPQTHSSEKERREPKERTKRSKLSEIQIKREEQLDLDRATLPPDAQDKGYETLVVQELRIATDNVRFFRKKYYSPSLSKTYLAPLPPGYGGEFGPNVKTLCVMFAHQCHMTEPKIVEWFAHMEIRISAGQVSYFLTEGHEEFHQEKEQIVEAGLNSSPWQHIDATGTGPERRRWRRAKRHGRLIGATRSTSFYATRQHLIL